MFPIPTSLPGLTKCKHLVPVSAKTVPGSGHEAVQPVGHRHGQQRGHKHRPHRADEGLCVWGHLGLQAAQARTQQHRRYACAREGAVRAPGAPAECLRPARLGTHLLDQTCKTLPLRPEPEWEAQLPVPADVVVAEQGHRPRCSGSRHSERPLEGGGGAGPGGCGASAILRLPYEDAGI